MFDFMDKDKSGTISFEELTSVVGTWMNMRTVLLTRYRIHCTGRGGDRETIK
jgi:Ca2+-binding EF-hand superfamily protein